MLHVLKKIKTVLKNIIGRLINLDKELNTFIYFREFEQRDDDIYVSTFMKSGTTWMQMILYQMLTDGDMSFEHIYDVSPWIMNEANTGKTAERVNALPSPRIIKTHNPYKDFDENSKARFIFVYRDGKDVAVSYNQHRKNYNNPEETFEETLDSYFKIGEEYNWFEYNHEWLRNPYKLNIYYVNYTDLKNNFEKTVKGIAHFLEVDLSTADLERIQERSSFGYMKKHESKFGEQPKDNRVFNNFIRKGEEGEGKKQFTKEQEKYFDESYNFLIKPFEKVVKD